MTCIAGILDKDGVIYIGGDSAGVGGLGLHIRADEKVFVNNKMIMGFTSSFRMGQLLRYKFSPPEFFGQKDVYDYMVNDFINGVRKCLKDGGFAKKKDEVEEGGTFIVGYKSRLFYVQDDYQIGEMRENFIAVGCGDDIALGSLYSTKNTKMKSEERIELALKSAEQFSAGVRSPFVIKKLKP